MTESSRSGRRAATLHEIRAMVGDIEAAKLEPILVTGAAGETDVMGDLERPLSGPVAAVYEIRASALPPTDECP